MFQITFCQWLYSVAKLTKKGKFWNSAANFVLKKMLIYIFESLKLKLQLKPRRLFEPFSARTAQP